VTAVDPAAIPGHTKPQAGRRLRALAARVPGDQAIVEIGVFKGRSAAYLGAGASEGGGAHVYAVDPWDLPGERYPFNWKEERPSRHAFTKPETRETAEAAIRDAGLSDRVTLVQMFSADAGALYGGPPVGLLHVDGDHRLDAVRADWAAWRPHLVPGATVCFDDHVPTCRDVIVAVAEIVAANELTRPTMATRRLAVCRYRG
jgi:hypothetical protein